MEWAEPRGDGGAEVLQQRRLFREAEYAEIKRSRHARAVADCKTAYDKKEEKKLVKQAATIERDIISLLDSDNSKSRATPLKRTVSQVGCRVASFGLSFTYSSPLILPTCVMLASGGSEGRNGKELANRTQA